MIVRIVRLSIAARNRELFLDYFRETYTQIRHFEGCHHLELFQDKNEPEIVITLSRWDHEEALNNYRNSEIFRQTWAKVKPLFSAPPHAFSMELIHP